MNFVGGQKIQIFVQLQDSQMFCPESDFFQYGHACTVCKLSLDEGMIPTTKKLSFKQDMKDKPFKCWIKSFLLCDSENGYVVNAEVYTGKREDAEEIDKLGISGNLVVRLTKDYYHQNYELYTDRFYTSVALAQYLLDKGIGLCGTANINRKEFLKQLIRKKKEMVRGEYHLLFNGSAAAIVWMDKKPIYFVTSLYITSPDEHLLRYDPNLHKRMPVPSPNAVKSYNEYMGGTDRNDQMTKLQKCIRHYKWPRRLVMKFFL